MSAVSAELRAPSRGCHWTSYTSSSRRPPSASPGRWACYRSCSRPAHRVVATLHEYGVWTAAGAGGGLRSAAWSAVERQQRADRETLVLTVRADRLLVTAPEHADVVHARFGDRRLDVTHVPIAPNIPVAG